MLHFTIQHKQIATEFHPKYQSGKNLTPLKPHSGHTSESEYDLKQEVICISTQYSFKGISYNKDTVQDFCQIFFRCWISPISPEILWILYFGRSKSPPKNTQEVCFESRSVIQSMKHIPTGSSAKSCFELFRNDLVPNHPTDLHCVLHRVHLDEDFADLFNPIPEGEKKMIK